MGSILGTVLLASLVTRHFPRSSRHPWQYILLIWPVRGDVNHTLRIDLTIAIVPLWPGEAWWQISAFCPGLVASFLLQGGGIGESSHPGESSEGFSIPCQGIKVLKTAKPPDCNRPQPWECTVRCINNHTFWCRDYPICRQDLTQDPKWQWRMFLISFYRTLWNLPVSWSP